MLDLREREFFIYLQNLYLSWCYALTFPQIFHSITVPYHSYKHLHVSPWQGSPECNIGSKGHCLSRVHNFSEVLLDWHGFLTCFLTDLWYPLGINVCYRAVLCFRLLLTLASINLRQSCWLCPFFLVCLKCMSVFLTGQWQKKCCMSYAAALLPSSCSSADKSSCPVVSKCRPCGLDLNITLLNFTAENNVLGTVSREWCSPLSVQAILLPLVLLSHLVLSHTYVSVHTVFITLLIFFSYKSLQL